MTYIKRVSRQLWGGRKIRLLSVLTLVFSAVLIVSAIRVVMIYTQGKQEEQAFTDLAAKVESVRQEQAISTESALFIEYTGPTESSNPITYTEYLTLYEENNDFAGWLQIENAKIDYPVMCTPEEPEYYLHRTFDKSDAYSGTPFIGANGTVDSDCFIIYGHCMSNRSMFGYLSNYIDREFWEENKTFLFSTVTEYREYEVFSAFRTRVLEPGEPGYRWYYQGGDLTEKAFTELTDYLLENSLYDTGVTPMYGEQIMLLATCNYHTENGRFLVAARRVDSLENITLAEASK